jgi:beta-galactosidase
VGIVGSVEGKSSIWAEALTPIAPDVRTLATYHDAGGWLDGEPAIVTRTVGRGSITYVGAWLDTATMAKLAANLLADAKVVPIVAGADPDLEIAERAGADKRLLIVINHGNVAHAVALPAGASPAVGDWADGRIAAHGVALFELARGGK